MKSGGVEVMGTVVVRNSVAKRVIVTLMPAISFLCMFGLAAIRDISECPVSFR